MSRPDAQARLFLTAVHVYPEYGAATIRTEQTCAIVLGCAVQVAGGIVGDRDRTGASVGHGRLDPSKNEAVLDVSHHTHVFPRAGRSFLLDILPHRMSVIVTRIAN